MIFQIFSPQLNATQVCEESLQNRTFWKKIQNKRRLKASPICALTTLYLVYQSALKDLFGPSR